MSDTPDEPRKGSKLAVVAGLAASIVFCFSPWGQVQVVGPDGIIVNTTDVALARANEERARERMETVRANGPCNHAHKGATIMLWAGEFVEGSLYCDGEHWISDNGTWTWANQRTMTWNQ